MNVYESFYSAYDFYNKKLFGGLLGNVVITLVRKPLVKGYYSFSRFEMKDIRGKKVSEISINPEYFGKVSEVTVLSTLVHEMVHMYHDLMGYKSCGGYHDKKWAELMEGIGLVPSSTGKAGGSKIGNRMSHYVDDNGLFMKVTGELLENGFTIEIKDYVDEVEIASSDVRKEGSVRHGRRFKYSCGCSNIWGKSSLDLTCNRCNQKFVCVE